MERLTMMDGFKYYAVDFEDELDKAATMANKLKTYEDTGYTPDEIEKMDHELYNLRNIVTYEYEKDYSTYEKAQEAKLKEMETDNE